MKGPNRTMDDISALDVTVGKVSEIIQYVFGHICRDTKLQRFQVKVIHRIIPCNKWLKDKQNQR